MRRAGVALTGRSLFAAGFAVATAAAAQAPFRLPAPTGPHPIGTTSWRLVDEARPESVSPTGGSRQVEILAWYPAARPASGTPAPYLRSGAAEVAPLARSLGAGAAWDGLASVNTHAVLDADPLESTGRLPVLVFSSGYTGVPSSHTALIEDLASFGYAVLEVVHPYEATAATLGDGRVVTMNGADGEPLPVVRDVVAEWGTEDATMAAVVRQADVGEQLRILREYAAGLSRTNVALRRWVDDARLVLDRLSRLPRESAAGRLAERLDLKRIGAFGHSFGGVAAGELCLEERRCRAALNLDGVPQYGAMAERRLARPFLMVYSARSGRAGASDAVYGRSASPYTRVDVRETTHLDFTDLAYWGGPLAARRLPGALAPDRVTTILRTVVREFFDRELLERDSPLLSGNGSIPEITVRRLP